MTTILVRGCRLGDLPSCSVRITDGVVTQVSEGELDASPEAEVVDANGGALFPGFIDTHCHPFEYGWLKRSVDLRGVTNMTAVRLRLTSAVQRAKPGEWVTGMGWDQEAFPGGLMPTRADIDDLSPANPVALSRVCGHIALLNTKAVEALGFESRRGEEFERSEVGRLTGIVKEGVLAEVFGKLPRNAERSAADLQSIEAEAARFGLTALHCILSPEGYREELDALALLANNWSLSLRFRVFVPPEAVEHVETRGFKERFQGDRVRLNGVKLYADGSLGARTAALREPYADDPANTGLLRYSDEELGSLVETLDLKGYQVIIHAIGDRAVEQAVGALSKVAGTRNPRRHRVEHASLLPKDLRSKMAKHGIRAAVQPLFITSDTWALARLGEERVKDLYPLKSMASEGVLASGGSDSPVESMSPVLAMWASMTRGGGTPEESLGMEDALSLYTENAASNGFDDHFRPEVGRPANLTLLDSDISGMHPALFRKVGVLATIVGGTIVHSYTG